MFFGGKQPEGRTVLLVDVENGSVGAALLRIEEEKRPRLFGFRRKNLPLLRSVSSALLAQEVVEAAREVLSHTSTVAARMRAHFKFRPLGSISRVELFLSPPWTNLQSPQWHHDDIVVTPLIEEITARFGHIPVSLHPSGRPLASVARGMYPEEETLLLASITGEVTELLLLHNGAIAGRATLPHGHHLLLRTLQSHNGMSEGEARSALRLPAHGGLNNLPMHEALRAAGSHFTEEFKDVARELLAPSTQSVLVVTQEPVGEWFARTFSEHSSLQELFPQGGTVRALRAHHVAPHIELPAPKDIFLMLEALYIDAHSSAPHARAV